jgi:L-idonate 5-dehydrogenase
MKTTRALLVAPEKLELQVIDQVPLAPSEVRVSMRYGTVCGSDVGYFLRGRIGAFELRDPFVLGHEGAGVVLETGSKVTNVAAGDRVAIHPGKACRRCAYCVAGRSNLCQHMRYLGSASVVPPQDGLFATDIVIEADQSHIIPDALPLDQASLVEPASVAMHAVNVSGLRAGDDVLVVGGGAVGLLFMRIAFALGAGKVTVADPSPKRRELAALLGASAVIDPVGTEPIQAAVVAESSGAAAGLDLGLRSARPGGTVVQVGSQKGGDPLPIQLVMSRELRLVGAFRFSEENTQVLALVGSGRLSLDGLISAEYPLADLASGIRAAAGGDHVRVRIALGSPDAV